MAAERPSPDRLEDLVLYAWVGEDEHGSGEIGLKQALTPAGFIPLVAVDREKIAQPYIVLALSLQAKEFGKTIRLCKFTLAGVLDTLPPPSDN